MAEFIDTAGTGAKRKSIGDAVVIEGVSAEKCGSKDAVTGRSLLPPGGRLEAHVHDGCDAVIYLVSGEVTISGPKGSHRAGPGTFVFIPRGELHAVANDGEEAAEWVFFYPGVGSDAETMTR